MSQVSQTPEWKNLFGVCAAVGEDLGINPLWLRLAFAMPLIWFPVPVLSAYAFLGVAVLASRRLFPDRKPAPAAAPREAEEPAFEYAQAA
jgi:phage shock protein C